ncbi:MAG TPA: hypothetical protein VM938_11315 [Acidimicrobiales bacterium]|nr:hypothetical protein [Acidimicrobiales bacterium]
MERLTNGEAGADVHVEELDRDDDPAVDRDGDVDATQAVPTDEAAAAAPVQQTRAGLVLQAVARTLPIYIASRLFTLGAIGLGTKMIPGFHLKDALLRWDASWYLGVIQGGYPRQLPEVDGLVQQNTVAFFPGFPLAARGFRAVTGQSPFVSAVAVAVLSGAVACVLLWILVNKLYDRRVADRTVALFAFFPSTFAMLLPFAEGLMLVFVIGCLLAMFDRRWVLAGVLAACATFTRPNAVVIGGCCLWEAVIAIRERREWRALVTPVMAPLGIVVYFLFLKFHTGELDAWIRTEEEGWGYSGTRLGEATWRALTVSLRDPFYDLNYVASTAALFFAVIGVALLIKQRVRVSLILLAAGVATLALSTGAAPASRPRYMLGAFPILIALARWADNERRLAMLVGCFATGLGGFVVLTTVTGDVIF